MTLEDLRKEAMNGPTGSKLKEIELLCARLRELAKAEWGDSDYECDCSHEPCGCECYMCESGWKLMQMAEIHTWEMKLLPILTVRELKGNE